MIVSHIPSNKVIKAVPLTAQEKDNLSQNSSLYLKQDKDINVLFELDDQIKDKIPFSSFNGDNQNLSNNSLYLSEVFSQQHDSCCFNKPNGFSPQVKQLPDDLLGDSGCFNDRERCSSIFKQFNGESNLMNSSQTGLNNSYLLKQKRVTVLRSISPQIHPHRPSYTSSLYNKKDDDDYALEPKDLLKESKNTSNNTPKEKHIKKKLKKSIFAENKVTKLNDLIKQSIQLFDVQNDKKDYNDHYLFTASNIDNEIPEQSKLYLKKSCDKKEEVIGRRKHKSIQGLHESQSKLMDFRKQISSSNIISDDYGEGEGFQQENIKCSMNDKYEIFNKYNRGPRSLSLLSRKTEPSIIIPSHTQNIHQIKDIRTSSNNPIHPLTPQPHPKNCFDINLDIQKNKYSPVGRKRKTQIIFESLSKEIQTKIMNKRNSKNLDKDKEITFGENEIVSVPSYYQFSKDQQKIGYQNLCKRKSGIEMRNYGDGQSVRSGKITGRFGHGVECIDEVRSQEIDYGAQEIDYAAQEIVATGRLSYKFDDNGGVDDDSGDKNINEEVFQKREKSHSNKREDHKESSPEKYTILESIIHEKKSSNPSTPLQLNIQTNPKSIRTKNAFTSILTFKKNTITQNQSLTPSHTKQEYFKSSKIKKKQKLKKITKPQEIKINLTNHLTNLKSPKKRKKNKKKLPSLYSPLKNNSIHSMSRSFHLQPRDNVSFSTNDTLFKFQAIQLKNQQKHLKKIMNSCQKSVKKIDFKIKNLENKINKKKKTSLLLDSPLKDDYYIPSSIRPNKNRMGSPSKVPTKFRINKLYQELCRRRDSKENFI